MDETKIAPQPGYEYELLSCPFCGSARAEVHGTVSAFGVCLDCGATTGIHFGRKAAADAWNRREYFPTAASGGPDRRAEQ